jgi:hypothetical protein
MPARVFRYLVTNKVQGHTLRLLTEHLCGGCYTSQWEPRSSIPSGTAGGVQAESCGFLTGTRGWVKYDLIRDSDGVKRALLYLYWTNPYFGVTFGKQTLVAMNLQADCDEDAPGAGSTFSLGAAGNDPPSDLKLKTDSVRKNGSPTNIDEVTDILRIGALPVPVWIFGAGQIWERMEIDVSLSSTSEPTLLPPPGARTRTLDTTPSPATLAGGWTGEHVRIDIAYHGFKQFHVSISDTTPGRPLTVNASCSLGAGGVADFLTVKPSVLRSMIVSDSIAATPQDIGRAAVALTSVSSALLEAGAVESAPASWLGLSVRPRTSAAELLKAATSYGVGESAVLTAATEAAAALMRDADFTLHPAPAIALRLYRELENNSLIGYSLHYQRLAEDGQVVKDTYLTAYIALH